MGQIKFVAVHPPTPGLYINLGVVFRLGGTLRGGEEARVFIKIRSNDTPSHESWVQLKKLAFARILESWHALSELSCGLVRF